MTLYHSLMIWPFWHSSWNNSGKLCQMRIKAHCNYSILDVSWFLLFYYLNHFRYQRDIFIAIYATRTLIMMLIVEMSFRCVWWTLDQIHKSLIAPVHCPTIHHFGTEMCTLWCIVGYGIHALWNLWNLSINQHKVNSFPLVMHIRACLWLEFIGIEMLTWRLLCKAIIVYM